MHLYVHIPFCRSRCAYCDFASEPAGPHIRAGRLEAYAKALRSELTQRARIGSDRSPTSGGGSADGGSFETIYVGGGTPTLLPTDMLVQLAVDLAGLLSAGGEFTVEANPGTVDAALLLELREAGVTRLSLGVQSFSASALAALGRRVSPEEIPAAIEALSEAGWQEWNLDLVFGIPGQSWEEAAADLEAAIAASPAHISLYDLTYTPAYDRWVKDRMGAGARGAAGAAAEEHYAEAVGRLEAAGYGRYEVSNFAQDGHECRHNLAYWRGEDYLGIGAAAVSTRGAERRTNPERVALYLEGRPPQVELLTPQTRLWEKAMLGLRTSEGVDEAAVASVVDQGALRSLVEQGCLERRYGRIRVNAGYLDVCNSVIATLLTTPAES